MASAMYSEHPGEQIDLVFCPFDARKIWKSIHGMYDTPGRAREFLNGRRWVDFVLFLVYYGEALIANVQVFPGAWKVDKHNTSRLILHFPVLDFWQYWMSKFVIWFGGAFPSLSMTLEA